MGPLAAGQVILVRFPFSDLSSSKLRPAVVLAKADHDDGSFVRSPASPTRTLALFDSDSTDLISGSLRLISFARPGKLFTAHSSLCVATIGQLKEDTRKRITSAVVSLLERSSDCHATHRFQFGAGVGSRSLDRALPSSASPSFANAVTNGTISITGLSEASGIVASRNNPDVLWTHNDSGHPAQIYAVDTQARLLGTYNIPGNSDNEDIAIGPGPVTNISYLYIGDIGDNGATRLNIKVYQIPEPAVYSNQFVNPGTYNMKGARTITLTYPDGGATPKAMFVDPITGALFILTKANPSRIYTAPKSQLDTNDSFTLTFVQTLAFNIPNAADIRFDGSEIIVRQEEFAGLWLRTNGQSIANAFLGTAYTIPVTGTANGNRMAKPSATTPVAVDISP